MELTIYTAPPMGRIFKYWRQKSPRYAHGWVVRFWWIGVSVRYGFLGPVVR